MAGEVGDKPSDWNLTTEVETVRLSQRSQPGPESPLPSRLGGSQAAGEPDVQGAAASACRGELAAGIPPFGQGRERYLPASAAASPSRLRYPAGGGGLP